MQDYKASKQVDQGALRMVQRMLCDFILKEIIDPKGSFYDDLAHAAWVHSKCSETVNLELVTYNFKLAVINLKLLTLILDVYLCR